MGVLSRMDAFQPAETSLKAVQAAHSSFFRDLDNASEIAPQAHFQSHVLHDCNEPTNNNISPHPRRLSVFDRMRSSDSPPGSVRSVCIRQGAPPSGVGDGFNSLCTVAFGLGGGGAPGLGP